MHLPLSTAEWPTGPGSVDDDPEAMARWSRRRVLAAAALTLALYAVLVTAGGSWAPAGLPLWTVLVALVALTGGATLATYLPPPGRRTRLDGGRSPCAAMGAASVLAAALLVQIAPHSPSMAAGALTVVGLGLFQRLERGTGCSAGFGPAPRSCASVPARPGGTPDGHPAGRARRGTLTETDEGGRSNGT